MNLQNSQTNFFESTIANISLRRNNTSLSAWTLIAAVSENEKRTVACDSRQAGLRLLIGLSDFITDGGVLVKWYGHGSRSSRIINVIFINKRYAYTLLCYTAWI